MISICFSCVVPRDCADVYKSGRHRNGIYTIDPDGEGVMEVFCDQVSVVTLSKACDLPFIASASHSLDSIAF